MVTPWDSSTVRMSIVLFVCADVVSIRRIVEHIA